MFLSLFNLFKCIAFDLFARTNMTYAPLLFITPPSKDFIVHDLFLPFFPLVSWGSEIYLEEIKELRGRNRMWTMESLEGSRIKRSGRAQRSNAMYLNMLKGLKKSSVLLRLEKNIYQKVLT